MYNAGVDHPANYARGVRFMNIYISEKNNRDAILDAAYSASRAQHRPDLAMIKLTQTRI